MTELKTDDTAKGELCPVCLWPLIDGACPCDARHDNYPHYPEADGFKDAPTPLASDPYASLEEWLRADGVVSVDGGDPQQPIILSGSNGLRRLRSFPVSQLFRGFLRDDAPSLCAKCGTPQVDVGCGRWGCPKCADEIKRTQTPPCPECGRPRVYNPCKGYMCGWCVAELVREAHTAKEEPLHVATPQPLCNGCGGFLVHAGMNHWSCLDCMVDPLLLAGLQRKAEAWDAVFRAWNKRFGDSVSDKVSAQDAIAEILRKAHQPTITETVAPWVDRHTVLDGIEDRLSRVEAALGIGGVK